MTSQILIFDDTRLHNHISLTFDLLFYYRSLFSGCSQQLVGWLVVASHFIHYRDNDTWNDDEEMVAMDSHVQVIIVLIEISVHASIQLSITHNSSPSLTILMNTSSSVVVSIPYEATPNTRLLEPEKYLHHTDDDDVVSYVSKWNRIGRMVWG